MTGCPVITAVRFDSAAIGIDGVDLRTFLSRQRVCCLEQDAPIVEDICREEIPGAVREDKRIASSQVHGFNDKSSCSSSRVHNAIIRQIKRTNTVLKARSDASRLTAGKGNFPNLPSILCFALPSEQHALNIEGERNIG